jgi:hypothetical protein
MFIVAMVAPLWGQTPAAKPGPNVKQTHWHKYVNKEFGFSLWYPGVYRAEAENIERRNDHHDHRGYLLQLTKRDNPGALIAVTIILAVPFFLESNAGGIPPSPRRIGGHIFHCGLGGSMGTGFSDECIFNLRGKTLF